MYFMYCCTLEVVLIDLFLYNEKVPKRPQEEADGFDQEIAQSGNNINYIINI